MHYLIGFSLGLMVIGNPIIKYAVKSVAHRKCHFTALIRLVLKEARWPEGGVVTYLVPQGNYTEPVMSRHSFPKRNLEAHFDSALASM